MSKNTKSLGPANDEGVPREELILAGMVQNAKAFGKKYGRGFYFIGESGRHLTDTENQVEKATRVCALGAWMLNSDALESPYTIGQIGGPVVAGNDSKPSDEDTGYFGPAYTLGMAFRHAMGGR